MCDDTYWNVSSYFSTGGYIKPRVTVKVEAIVVGLPAGPAKVLSR